MKFCDFKRVYSFFLETYGFLAFGLYRHGQDHQATAFDRRMTKSNLLAGELKAAHHSWDSFTDAEAVAQPGKQIFPYVYTAPDMDAKVRWRPSVSSLATVADPWAEGP